MKQRMNFDAALVIETAQALCLCNLGAGPGKCHLLTDEGEYCPAWWVELPLLFDLIEKFLGLCIEF